MSGGSFNYLYDRDLVELKHTVRQMQGELAALGLEDAAARTGMILARMDQIESIQAEMRDVWKAVEWLKSGDWGVDFVEEAVRAWREKMDAFKETITTGTNPKGKKG